MEQINSLKLGDTGYSAGDLFVGDLETRVNLYIPKKEELVKSPSFLYDINTGNVHMFPKCLYFAKQCSDEIKSKIDEIKKYLGTKNYKVSSSSAKRNTFSDSTFEQSCYIFNLLRIKLACFTYEIEFNRFFKTTDKKVNCILKSIQFEVYDKSYKSYSLYPDSDMDNDRSIATKTSFYYNPPVKFGESAEKIGDAFIKFIEENEKNQNE